jgi:Flp pilus assembly protein TadB
MNYLSCLCSGLIAVLSYVIIYTMFPVVYLYLHNTGYRQIKEEVYDQQLVRLVRSIPFNLRIQSKIIDCLENLGIHNSRQLGLGFFIAAVLLIIPLIFMINSKVSWLFITVFLASMICLPALYLKNRTHYKNRIFVMNAFKLYHFLHSQISSGIKVTDAVKGLYEIVDHPAIQNVLIRFVAQYELTLNITDSLRIIRRSFPGYDCDMLCVSIEQCVNTGMAGRTLLKMEGIMFSKYFNYLQKETESYRTKILISGIFAIVPLVMIFLLPMIYDAFKGFEQILDSAVMT